MNSEQLPLLCISLILQIFNGFLKPQSDAFFERFRLLPVPAIFHQLILFLEVLPVAHHFGHAQSVEVL